GKTQLRIRLMRMGFAPAAAAFVADLGAEALTAAVPPTLSRSTSAAAIALASGTTAAVPASILTLTEGVEKAMFIQSWKSVFIVGAALGRAGVGPGVGSTAGDPPHATERPTAVPPLPPPVVDARPAVAATDEVNKPHVCATTNFIVHGMSPRITRLVADAA